jgi:multicomponent Na+:H+ antiporter subunit G
MIDIIRIIAALGVVIGSLFGLLAAVGIVRFPDLYTRLHAASKAGAVGTGLILLALAVVSLDMAVIIRSIIAILFVLLTTPLSAHLLARAGYMTGVKLADLTKTNEIP